jgi:catechol 2,3-dioxygenase-like lactoylglutathione lyase family enzyme
MRLANVALLVRDYDDAITWFTDKLGFTLAEDTDLGDSKRWVRVAAPGGGSDLLLAKPVNAHQSAAIGNAGGGRVCFFIHTDDFWRDYNAMKSKDVTFTEQPREEAYGRVVVFLDLYGNKWDLVELATTAKR